MLVPEDLIDLWEFSPVLMDLAIKIFFNVLGK